MNFTDILIIVGAYLLGAIPFGYILTRYKAGADIRTMGSGNIGATNVLRTQGKLLALVTLVLDFSKGAFPVWAGLHWGHAPWMNAAAGAAAVVGHCFPVFLGFRGGKGIATGLGAFLFIAPVPTLIALCVFLAEVLTIRFVSLGSVLASLTFGAILVAGHFASGRYNLEVAALGAGIALLLVARHHSNIGHLLDGTESRLWGDKRRVPREARK
jgi:glycerol-3-phosphate acyltransferase PlsY